MSWEDSQGAIRATQGTDLVAEKSLGRPPSAVRSVREEREAAGASRRPRGALRYPPQHGDEPSVPAFEYGHYVHRHPR